MSARVGFPFIAKFPMNAVQFVRPMSANKLNNDNESMCEPLLHCVARIFSYVLNANTFYYQFTTENNALIEANLPI